MTVRIQNHFLLDYKFLQAGTLIMWQGENIVLNLRNVEFQAYKAQGGKFQKATHAAVHH